MKKEVVSCDICEKRIADEEGHWLFKCEKRTKDLEGELFRLEGCEECRKALDMDSNWLHKVFLEIIGTETKRPHPELERCEICDSKLYVSTEPLRRTGSYTIMIWAGTANPYMLCGNCSHKLPLTREAIIELLKKSLISATETS